MPVMQLLQLGASWLPTVLLLYWGLAAGAAIVALTPLPFAAGFRSVGPRLGARRHPASRLLRPPT